MLTFLEHCTARENWTQTICLPEMLGQADELCLLLLRGGSCSFVLDGEGPEAAFVGDVLLLTDAAMLTPAGSCQLAGTVLAGQAPRAFLQALTQPVILLKRGHLRGAEAILQQLAEGREQLAPTEAGALAYTLLCRAAQAVQQPGAIPPLVAAALDEIREHYAEVYGVEELADTLLINKSYLIRSFTACMGLSPGRYLTLVRVENAKRLLLQGAYTLDIVASLCGFSGANYLCKVFKRETGETPAAWRRGTLNGYLPVATALEEQVYL